MPEKLEYQPNDPAMASGIRTGFRRASGVSLLLVGVVLLTLSVLLYLTLGEDDLVFVVVVIVAVLAVACVASGVVTWRGRRAP